MRRLALPSLPRAAVAVFAAVALTGPLAAQEPRPGLPPQGGPPPQRQGQPRPGGPNDPGGYPPFPFPDPGFLAGQTIRALEEKADLLIEQKKTDAAIEEMRRVFSLDVPREGPAFELKAHLVGRLAITLANAGRKKEAVETMQRLLAAVPAGSVAEATAWLDAGVVYRQAGLPDEALKAYERSIELSQKLARLRGSSGPPPQYPPGRPPRPPQQPPRGDEP
jgi:tetratricopeptide (TPR) repeat protein